MSDVEHLFMCLLTIETEESYVRYLKEGKGKTSENFKSGKNGADRKSYDLELECVCVLGWRG